VNRPTKFYIRSFTRSWDIRGYPKNFGSHVTRLRPFFEKNNQGLLLRLTRWIVLPNFTFVALPVPKILGGTLKMLGVTWQGHTPFFGKNSYRDLFRLSLWISVPNFTFVALPVPGILGGTLKILGVTWPRPCQIFGKKIIPFCFACPCENVRQIFIL